MRVLLVVWLSMLCSMLASGFRMVSPRSLAAFSASNLPLNTCTRSFSSALCMATISSRKLSHLRRHYASLLRGKKDAQQKEFPTHLRRKPTQNQARSKADHVPVSMRRKATERAVSLLPGENRLRKRQGIAAKLSAREKSKRAGANTAALGVEATEDWLEDDGDQSEQMMVSEQFKKDIIKARRSKDFAGIAEVVKRHEQDPEQPLNAAMAAYAIRLLVKLNQTALATQLLPSWHACVDANVAHGHELDVGQIGSLVKHFCKSWQPATAVEICKHYGLDTSTWTFQYKGQDETVAEKLAHQTLPDLFMGFCVQGDVETGLDVTRGLLEYGLMLDDASAASAMRYVLTMGTADQALRYLGTVRKQLRDSDSPEELQLVAGRFASNTTFVKGCVSNNDLPEDSFPEVAFLGRSNVGKSSLLNALVARRSLARTSGTPGKTQEFNYFLAGPHLVRESPKYHTRKADDDAAARSPAHAQYRRPFYMVDVPGVGYAKVSRLQRKGWFQQLSTYIRSRQTLQAVCHLVDSRVGPVEADIELMKLLAELPPHVPYIAVLTKMDKSSNRSKYQSLDNVLEQMKENLTAAGLMTPERTVAVVPVSAKDKQGVIDLWKLLIEKVIVEQPHEVEANKKRRKAKETAQKAAQPDTEDGVKAVKPKASAKTSKPKSKSKQDEDAEQLTKRNKARAGNEEFDEFQA